MEKPLAEHTLRELCSSVAARTAVPGGGSVSAAAAALAASCGAMAARFSLPRDGADPILEEIVAELENDTAAYLRAVGEDAEAYERVRRARRLPKATPEEKGARKEAVRTALRGATQVPLDNLRAVARTALRLADLASRCNPNLASDLAVARELLVAARHGFRENVQTNLDGFVKAQDAADLRAAYDAARQESSDALSAIREIP